jgi:hypothetical protein
MKFKIGDLAAPIPSDAAAGLTQSSCQIQLMITAAMNADSLFCITMCPSERTTTLPQLAALAAASAVPACS